MVGKRLSIFNATSGVAWLALAILADGQCQCERVFAQEVPAAAPPGAILPSPPVDLARAQAPITAPGSPLIIRPSAEAAPPPGADTIETTVSDVVLDGVTAYKPEALRPEYADVVGKRVPLSALYATAQRIEARYRRDGYILARVVVPEQAVGDGRFHLRVVEGYVGSVEIQGDPGSDRSLIRRYLEKTMRAHPARLRDLERYLLLANDLPGIAAQAVLTPEAGETGAATLVVDVHRKAVDAYATLDNRGSDFTGPVNGTLDVGVNGLTSLGGRAEALLFTTFDREQQYGELSLSGNLGDEGGRVRAYAAYGPSRPGSTLSQLDVNSWSTVLGVSGDYPLIRSRTLNLSLNGAFEATEDRTNILVTPASLDRQRILRFGALVSDEDPWGGANTASLTLHKGLTIFDATHNGDRIPQSRAGGSSDFFKLTGTASRLQPIYAAPDYSLAVLGSFAGQYGADKLLALEQFRLGGEQFGRGYIPGELSGDDGVSASVELQFSGFKTPKPLSRYQLYAFYDYGAVRDRGAGAWQDLQSAGGGVRFDIGPRWSGEVELADPYSRGRTDGDHRDKSVQAFFRLTARY